MQYCTHSAVPAVSIYVPSGSSAFPGTVDIFNVPHCRGGTPWVYPAKSPSQAWALSFSKPSPAPRFHFLPSLTLIDPSSPQAYILISGSKRDRPGFWVYYRAKLCQPSWNFSTPASSSLSLAWASLSVNQIGTLMAHCLQNISLYKLLLLCRFLKVLRK